MHRKLRRHWPSAVVRQCRCEGCRLKLDGVASSDGMTVLDADKYGGLTGHAGKQCDCLVFVTTQGLIAAAVELKSGAFRGSEVAEQLQSGADQINTIAGTRKVGQFFPTVGFLQTLRPAEDIARRLDSQATDIQTDFKKWKSLLPQGEGAARIATRWRSPRSHRERWRPLVFMGQLPDSSLSYHGTSAVFVWDLHGWIGTRGAIHCWDMARRTERAVRGYPWVPLETRVDLTRRRLWRIRPPSCYPPRGQRACHFGRSDGAHTTGERQAAYPNASIPGTARRHADLVLQGPPEVTV